MIFCVIAPVIGLIVWVIIAAVDKQHNWYQPPPRIDSPKTEPPAHASLNQDDRSLADKLDTRITNIFRNPWEGIL